MYLAVFQCVEVLEPLRIVCVCVCGLMRHMWVAPWCSELSSVNITCIVQITVQRTVFASCISVDLDSVSETTELFYVIEAKVTGRCTERLSAV